MKKIKTYSRLLVFYFMCFASLALADDTPKPNFWVPNFYISASVIHGNYTYIGGSFTYVGPNTGSGAKLSTTTAAVDTTLAKVIGNINCAVPDGAGGWFIGGSFSQVGSLHRDNLAKINADGSVDPDWNPATNSIVFDIGISGGSVFVGGAFTFVNSITPRSYVAKFSASGTGALDPDWDPHANSYVRALAVSGSDIFIGGNFTMINGATARNHIAKIPASGTGIVDALWNPNVNGAIETIAINGSNLYIGGNFTTVNGGTSRICVAKFTTSGDGTADALWNPVTNGNVLSIAANASDVFIGGDFSMVNGSTSRNRLAKIPASGDGTVDASWDPDVNNTVTWIALEGSDVFVCGNFTTINGSTTRNYIAKIPVSGAGTVDASWNPNPSDNVICLAVNSGSIYIGGAFKSIGGIRINRIARINNTTGVVDASWNPNSDTPVNALAVSGGNVYAGGFFSSIGGQVRNRIACLDTITGSATSWNPNANSGVSKIVVSGSDVYVGGYFGNIGGLARNHLAKLDAVTGLASSWDPNSDNSVVDLAINGNSVFAVGTFLNIGGQARNRIAKLDAVTGLADAVWNPNADDEVYCIAVNGNDIYTGGDFSSIGGQTRNYIAKLDNVTGSADALWNANADEDVTAITIIGDDIYAGGFFGNIGGLARNCFAKLNHTTGAAYASWNPDPDYVIYNIDMKGHFMSVSGGFSSMKGNPLPSLAVFSQDELISVGKDFDAGVGYVNFNNASDTTAVSISINSGAGSGRINVYRYADSPANVTGITGNISEYRWIVQQRSLASTFTGQIKFKVSEIPRNGIFTGANVVVYSRPTPGSGAFTPLVTSYNSGTDELTAQITSFSEFAFGSLTEPLPVELSSFTSSVNKSNVKLNWSTVTEENNSGFDIERKNINESVWIKIGNKAGAGNSGTGKNYNFEDRNLGTGKYNYRLKQIDVNGNFKYYSLSNEVVVGVPNKFALSQNYPNPFNPSTIINYQLAINSFVTLRIYDISGREIKQLVNEVKEAGYYSVSFDAKSLSSGTYFYKLSTDNFSDVKKMVVVK